MATSQYAFQTTSVLTQQFSQVQAHPTAIDFEHISVSQLLGRDYIFINTREVQLPANNPSLLHSFLNDIVQQLELAEAHTVAVSVDESETGILSFARHDLSWYKHKICKVESIAITHPEQHEFMEMIFRCSTAAVVS